MISALIGSYLISIAGLIVYAGIRNKLSISVRKKMVSAVLILSLVLPALIWAAYHGPEIPRIPQTAEVQVTDVETARALVTQLPETGQLKINEHHVNIFQPIAVFDWWLTHRNQFNRAAVILALIAFSFVLMRISWLLWLIKTSTSRADSIDGFKFHWLYRDSYSGPGSFRLHCSYIIWNDSLDQLDPATRRAILLHEIAHLKGKHTLQMIGMELMRPLWLLNPAWYFLKREMRALNEFLADAFAVQHTGDRIAYANLLLDTASPGKTGQLCQSFGTHPVQKRIQQVLHPAVNKLPVWSAAFSIIFALTAASLVSVPVCLEEETEIAAYEIKWCINQATGQLIFCDDCYTEGLDCACIVE